MDEKTASSHVSSTEALEETPKPKEDQVVDTAPSSEIAGSEKRQAFGTAKTENLRDSGLWRFLLPAVVILFALTLFVVPLVILIPLLTTSIDGLRAGNTGEGQLLWIWIAMIVLELAVCVVITRWLFKVFMTQAFNYSR